MLSENFQTMNLMCSILCIKVNFSFIYEQTDVLSAVHVVYYNTYILYERTCIAKCSFVGLYMGEKFPYNIFLNSNSIYMLYHSAPFKVTHCN
jgi:hypothetical protein